MTITTIQHDNNLLPKPTLLRWEEGASLIRSSTNLIAEQLAWSGYFFLSAGIDRGDNIPIADVDANYVAKVLLLFASDSEVLRSIVQSRLCLHEIPPLHRHDIMLQVEKGISFAKSSLFDSNTHSLLMLFFVHLNNLLNSADQPCSPLDLYYLSKVVVNAVSPISYVEAILNGEDFREL